MLDKNCFRVHSYGRNLYQSFEFKALLLFLGLLSCLSTFASEKVSCATVVLLGDQEVQILTEEETMSWQQRFLTNRSFIRRVLDRTGGDRDVASSVLHLRSVIYKNLGNKYALNLDDLIRVVESLDFIPGKDDNLVAVLVGELFEFFEQEGLLAEPIEAGDRDLNDEFFHLMVSENRRRVSSRWIEIKAALPVFLLEAKGDIDKFAAIYHDRGPLDFNDSDQERKGFTYPGRSVPYKRTYFVGKYDGRD